MSKTMNLKQAAKYALEQLETKLPETLYYHGVHHTRDDVVPAVKRLAEMCQLDEEKHDLLVTAAWYHDIGFTEQYQHNEPIGVRIASEVLPDFGYTKSQINVIAGIIIATQPPQTPHNLLEQLMVDADLDSIGRADFLQVAQNLRREEEIHLNKKLTDQEWYWAEMQFMRKHRYFTSVQRRYRTSGKVQNFLKLYRLMAGGILHL